MMEESADKTDLHKFRQKETTTFKKKQSVDYAHHVYNRPTPSQQLKQSQQRLKMKVRESARKLKELQQSTERITKLVQRGQVFDQKKSKDRKSSTDIFDRLYKEKDERTLKKELNKHAKERIIQD